MRDYCISYKCEATSLDNGEESQEWEIVAVACICFEKELWNDANAELRNYDAMFNPDKVSEPPVSIKKSTTKEYHNFKRFSVYLGCFIFQIQFKRIHYRILIKCIIFRSLI